MVHEVRSTQGAIPAPAVPEDARRKAAMEIVQQALEVAKPGIQDETARARETAERTSPPRRIVQDVVDELNEVVHMINTRLSFSIDEETRQTVVKVMDADTQKVLRQIPAEEMLRVSRRIHELLGLLVDESA